MTDNFVEKYLKVISSPRAIAEATNVVPQKKRYIVYRNANLDTPDEIIETDVSVHAELVNRLRADPSVCRVDLEIHQVFSWKNYISFVEPLKEAMQTCPEELKR